jgi:hypothetical protein
LRCDSRRVRGFENRKLHRNTSKLVILRRRPLGDEKREREKNKLRKLEREYNLLTLCCDSVRPTSGQKERDDESSASSSGH